MLQNVKVIHFHENGSKSWIKMLALKNNEKGGKNELNIPRWLVQIIVTQNIADVAY